ncbi:hypothetical protein BJX68DRAFT_261062 [Aspergillus pseudodeflectus]|uniref:Uncharacterized protein n=1 Tax=Aspergillus pseudodeflectus TaxID=176178 RepID=A0ABR4L6G7_9EURO
MTTLKCTTPSTLCPDCTAIKTNLSLSPKITRADPTTQPKTYPIIFWKTMPGSTDLPNLYLFCRRAERMLATEAKVTATVWTSIFKDKGEAGTKTVKILVDFAGFTPISEDIKRRLFEGAAENVGVGLKLPTMLADGKLAAHPSLVRLEFFNGMHEAAREGRLLNPNHVPLSITV